jgi:TolB protein
MQKLNQDSIIEITGWAVDKNVLKEKQMLEEKVSEIDGEYSIKKVVYTSTRDGNENIYSINLDGTGLTRLTDHPGSDLYPEASPDGKKIAYTSDIGGIWQIMIMDWDGKNKKQITYNHFRSGYPSWSYDSKYIYFEAYIDGDWELFRIKSDGTEQKRLTFNPNFHDWHPNGHPYNYEIIYESGITGQENIYVMDHNGSGKRNVCDDGPRRRAPDVSPDGSRITYMSYSGDNSEIWIMDYNGQNEIRLTDNPDWDGHPSFSPDGKYIVYEEGKESVEEDLILMDLITGQRINITNSPYIDADASFLYQE